jgi:hypothetical protein
MVSIDGVSDYILNLFACFTTQLGNTSNYSVIANIHNLQITTAPAKSFPACYAFTSRSLVTASSSGDSSSSALKQ